CAADGGGVTSGLHFELLHAVRRRAEVERVESRVGICCAVEQEVVCVGTIAADAYRGALAGTPVEWAHVACLGAVRFVCSGDSQNEIDQHAAVQRQVADGGGLDYFSDRGVRCLQNVNGVGLDVDDSVNVLKT